MNQNIRIREFHCPHDYQAVYHLWATAGDGIHLRRSDEPAEIEKRIGRDPDLFLVVESDEEIIGTVMGGG